MGWNFVLHRRREICFFGIDFGLCSEFQELLNFRLNSHHFIASVLGSYKVAAVATPKSQRLTRQLSAGWGRGFVAMR